MACVATPLKSSAPGPVAGTLGLVGDRVSWGNLDSSSAHCLVDRPCRRVLDHIVLARDRLPVCIQWGAVKGEGRCLDSPALELADLAHLAGHQLGLTVLVRGVVLLLPCVHSLLPSSELSIPF